jgi:glutaminyl-peptide cyclotransferase
VRLSPRLIAGLFIVNLVVLGVVLALVAGVFSRDDGGEPAVVSAAPSVDRFDARRAFAHLRMQVEMGPRPAGSPTLRRLAERLRDELPRGRFERIPGHPGLRNVVGHLPGSRPAVVFGAHYDTKDVPGFVGANDGASGTAAVVEIARAMRRVRRGAAAPELRFVLFDGEEAPDEDGGFYATGLRGSKAYVRAHKDEIGALVLLDFVGERNVRLPREGSSNRDLWRRLRAAARRAGALRAFPDDTAGTVLDDHTPFLRQGIPAIDLIDFEFSCFHKRCDDMDVISARSLDVVGETVVELLRTWR